MSNKATLDPTYIHSSCRIYTNNKARAKRTSDGHDEQVSAKRIAPENDSSSNWSVEENFDFKKKCFYWAKVCEYDDKHPGQNKFVPEQWIPVLWRQH